MAQLKPITTWTFKMKVIKDLGMKKPTENYYKKVRMAVFECTYCKTHFESVVSKKAENQLFCKYCNGISNRKPHRDHRLFKVWTDTRGKLKKTNKRTALSYKDKNIQMCSEWDSSFDSFFEWAVNNGWAKGLTLDRINNDGNYEPSNCRWVNYSVQVVNQRPIKCNNTTGFKGINPTPEGKYVAHIKYEHRAYGLGSFGSKLEAAKAYDSFVKIMGWPHSHNGTLTTNEIVFPTNRNTLKYLSSIGIHESDFVSKEP